MRQFDVRRMLQAEGALAGSILPSRLSQTLAFCTGGAGPCSPRSGAYAKEPCARCCGRSSAGATPFKSLRLTWKPLPWAVLQPSA